ncbi:MAG: hypothetical protein ACYST9_00580 [Planctomycetota bacterium]|jgi:hypothetical protein
MQLKLDAKTLMVGIAVGVVLTVAIVAGVGSAESARFGIAVEEKGAALVQTSSGSLYIVNPRTGMATRVLRHGSLNQDPGDSRNGRSNPLSLTMSTEVKKQSKK